MQASLAAESILRAYPSTDARASEAYAKELLQFLATLSEQELEWVMDVRHGIKARCKFLPGPADINELLNEKRAARDAYSPSPTTGGYQKLQPGDEIEQPPGERRKAQVLELLGYDPAAPMKRIVREELTEPTSADIEALKGKVKVATKSDATPQLKALLAQDMEAASYG